MGTNKTVVDVFISHSAADTDLAYELSCAFKSAGLQTFTLGDIPVGQNAGDVLWEALAESAALVTIVSSAELSPMMLVEIGGAQVWNKPIFPVVSDPATVKLPSALSKLRPYSPGGVDEIIREIKSQSSAWSMDDSKTLVEVYKSIGVPVDRLALEPAKLAELTKQFQEHRHRTVTAESLLRILLRFRKQGSLPRTVQSRGRKPRAKSS